MCVRRVWPYERNRGPPREAKRKSRGRTKSTARWLPRLCGLSRVLCYVLCDRGTLGLFGPFISQAFCSDSGFWPGICEIRSTRSQVSPMVVGRPKLSEHRRLWDRGARVEGRCGIGVHLGSGIYRSGKSLPVERRSPIPMRDLELSSPEKNR